MIESGRLFLDRISQLAKSPSFLMFNRTTIIGDGILEFFYRFLYLLFR